jgi:hypothetical protein
MIGQPENCMSKAESGLQDQAWRALLLIYASVQFLLLTAIAMLVYPAAPSTSRTRAAISSSATSSAIWVPPSLLLDAPISPRTSFSPSLWAAWVWR